MGPTRMILQWIACFIIHTFDSKQPIRDLNTVEIIDSVIEHYSVLELNPKTHPFIVYSLPMKSFYAFKELVKKFISAIEYSETPKFLNLITIANEENGYIKYFKRAPKGFLNREQARVEVLALLKTIKRHLELISKTNSEDYTYYSSRAEIIISHCVSILEVLTHE